MIPYEGLKLHTEPVNTNCIQLVSQLSFLPASLANPPLQKCLRFLIGQIIACGDFFAVVVFGPGPDVVANAPLCSVFPVLSQY